MQNSSQFVDDEGNEEYEGNLDLNELQSNYVGKLYVAPGAVVPSHLSNLQVCKKNSKSYLKKSV